MHQVEVNNFYGSFCSGNNHTSTSGTSTANVTTTTTLLTLTQEPLAPTLTFLRTMLWHTL
jgi:hypothetical protein